MRRFNSRSLISNFTSSLMLLVLLMHSHTSLAQHRQSSTSAPEPFYPWEKRVECNEEEQEEDGYSVIAGKYVFSAQAVRCNKLFEVWLMKSDRSQPLLANGYQPYIIVDHMVIRPLKSGEMFSLSHHYHCHIGKKPVEWAAIYEWKKRKRITGRDGQILDAWIVNPKTEKFERAPDKLIRSVTCTLGEEE
jgi:hypothetical protein